MSNETTTAPAAAAVADARRLANRLSALRVRVEYDNGGSAEWMTDGAGLINAICDRAEAAEAERDRLALEVAALRGAMPDADQLALDSRFLSEFVTFEIGGDLGNDDVDRISNYIDDFADTLRFLSATPPPPAAEAVTGGGAELRGLEALLRPDHDDSVLIESSYVAGKYGVTPYRDQVEGTAYTGSSLAAALDAAIRAAGEVDQ